MLKLKALGAALLAVASLAAVGLVVTPPPPASAAEGGIAAPSALCTPSPVGDAPEGTPSGGFHALTPERVLDTRVTIGKVQAGCTAVVDLSGVIPSQATGAALDVVAVDADGPNGYVTVYPCGSPRPLASNLNPRTGQATPNAVVLPVDGTGRACLYTALATQLVVDVTGWFGPGGESFHGIQPLRTIDTRTANGGSGPVGAATVLTVPVANVGPVPAGATGAVVNLTVTGTQGAGWITAFPCGTAVPLASTGNYEANDTRANQAFVGLGGGNLCVYTSATVDIIVDVVGWFSGGDGTRAIPLTGTRVVDSRDGTGGWVGPIGPGQVRSFDPTVQGTLPVGAAAVLDVVATDAAAAGWITVYPCGAPVPATSSVNVTPGVTATNVAVSALGTNGLICVSSVIQTHVVIDVEASFGAPGALQGLTVSGGALHPAFTQDGHDYGVICNAGSNAWTVSPRAVPGATVAVSGANGAGQVTVAEDDLVTITVTKADASSEQYFVRCLPHDFPVLAVARPDDPAPGWYLTSTGFNAPVGATYAVILDDHGAVIWYEKTPTNVLDVKRLPNGNLAWVKQLGTAFGSTAGGAYEEHALDGSLVKNWSTVGADTDHHDMWPLANGNMMLISYHVRSGVDLTSLPGGGHGANEMVVDGWLQEIRPNGTVAWEWHSEDHIGLSETIVQLDGLQVEYDIPAGHVTDLLHINSVDIDAATGDVIVSARHLDAVFRVRRNPGQPDDGTILWKLGGTAPTSGATTDLTILNDPLNGPARQHDARLSPDGHLTMFDNQSGKPQASRGVDYLIDPVAGTARLVWQYSRTDGLNAFGLGSVRRDPTSGSSLIGWGGSPPLFTDIGPYQNPTLQVSLPPSGLAYRAVKEPLSSFDAAVLRANAGG